MGLRRRTRTYAPGARVRLAGLARPAHLNGALGVVAGFGTKRYLVDLDDDPRYRAFAGASVRCHARHLEPSSAPHPAAVAPVGRFRAGARVVVTGFVAPELRGAVGTVLAFRRDHYAVELDEERLVGGRPVGEVRCRPRSLARAGASAGPRPTRSFAAPRFSPSTPDWVRELVLAVLRQHDAPLGSFEWRPRARARGRLGYAEGRQRVVVSCGRDAAEQRRVVLHELAHTLTPGQMHGPRFWDTYWALCRDHGVDLAAALEHEERRRSRGAAAAYRRAIGSA